MSRTMATDPGRIAYAFLTTFRGGVSTLISILIGQLRHAMATPVSNRRTSPWRTTAVAVACVVLGATGCSTPDLKSSVEVPNRYASADATTTEPEVAWWERYGDPVLSDLIRRAAYENRDVKIAAERVRAARAGETISRSRLFPSLDFVGTGFDRNTGHSDVAKHTGLRIPHRWVVAVTNRSWRMRGHGSREWIPIRIDNRGRVIG